MQNETFTKVVGALRAHLGTDEPLPTGYGTRFKSARKGKATIYHSNVSAGNQAEIAFEVTSMAKRLGMSEGEFRSFVSDLRASTGRSVDSSPQYGWPRVGIASNEDVSAVVDALARKLAEAA